MTPKAPSSKEAWIQLNERQATGTGRLLLLLLLLTLPVVVQAQFTYTTNKGAITITGYTGPGGAVLIPDAISGLPVTCIGSGACSNCWRMTSVTIPQSVTQIEPGAFYDCNGLTNVTIGTNVTSIADEAFYSCYRLTSVTIPNSVIILGDETGKGVFYYCHALTNVTIGNSVAWISSLAFYDCYSLTNVTIPHSVTNMGAAVFAYCSSLTGVYFKCNPPSIGSTLFYGDDKMTVYYLPRTTGWGSTFGGRPTALWNPLIQTSNASWGVRTNPFGFNIVGTPSIPIVVEASTNLTSASWTSLQSCTLTNGSIYFSDPQWTNYVIRFYRIRSP